MKCMKSMAKSIRLMRIQRPTTTSVQYAVCHSIQQTEVFRSTFGSFGRCCCFELKFHRFKALHRICSDSAHVTHFIEFCHFFSQIIFSSISFQFCFLLLYWQNSMNAIGIWMIFGCFCCCKQLTQFHQWRKLQL